MQHEPAGNRVESDLTPILPSADTLIATGTVIEIAPSFFANVIWNILDVRVQEAAGRMLNIAFPAQMATRSDAQANQSESPKDGDFGSIQSGWF